MYRPPISIIIAVKNAKASLQRTLHSIEQQQYAPLEALIIDGDSHDGTLDGIERYSCVREYLSEPDNGISEAANKGIALAKGEYIYFLGAGDTLYDPTSFSRLLHNLDPSYTLVCGQVLRVQADGITPVAVAPRSFRHFNPQSFLWKMALPHQGLLMHRSYFERYGYFDTQCRFAMDYELLLRSWRSFPKIACREMIVARWCQGGIGSAQISKVLSEYHQIRSRHQLTSPWALQGIYWITLIKYHLKKKLFRLNY